VTRKEQALASRALLLESARRCFTEVGYDQATVAAILEGAGMARGALYHYFPGGKEDIFTAVFDMIDATYHQRRNALIDLPSPVARLRAGSALFLEMCMEEDFARIVLADAPRIVPGQGERGSTYLLLRAQVAEAIARGEFEQLDADATALALYGACRSVGEFVMGADDRAKAWKVARHTVDVLIDGLLLGRSPA
jgi:AcrR family transcriptional regulator